MTDNICNYTSLQILNNIQNYYNSKKYAQFKTEKADRVA